jgi:hypothetical protein
LGCGVYRGYYADGPKEEEQGEKEAAFEGNKYKISAEKLHMQNVPKQDRRCT